MKRNKTRIIQLARPWNVSNFTQISTSILIFVSSRAEKQNFGHTIWHIISNLRLLQQQFFSLCCQSIDSSRTLHFLPFYIRKLPCCGVDSFCRNSAYTYLRFPNNPWHQLREHYLLYCALEVFFFFLPYFGAKPNGAHRMVDHFSKFKQPVEVTCFFLRKGRSLVPTNPIMTIKRMNEWTIVAYREINAEKHVFPIITPSERCFPRC